MGVFWNRLQKLSCSWVSEWGPSWPFWGSGDGYCSTDKALAAGTAELQLFVTDSREMCDVIVTVLSHRWHSAAQKDLAKLSCWKSHEEHGTDFDSFQNLCLFTGVWNSFLQKQFSKEIFSSSNLWLLCWSVNKKEGFISGSLSLFCKERCGGRGFQGLALTVDTLQRRRLLCELRLHNT